MTTTSDLTTWTPVQIDTALAVLYRAETRLIFEVQAAAQSVYRYANLRPASSEEPGSRRSSRLPVGTLDEAIARCESGDGVESWDRRGAAAAAVALAEARAALAANHAEQEPYRAEYLRRGRWTRAFVAVHVHSSMNCSTCNRMGKATRFGWLPTLSGLTEEQIVAEAGSDACTVCYPTAPVKTAPTRTVFTAEEQEERAARDERQRERDAAKAAKAAKAITAPDGSEVRGYWGVVATEVTARNECVAAFATVEQYQREAAQGPSNADTLRSLAVDYRVAGERLLEALAAKHGVTVDEERAALQPKIDKKVRAYFR